MQPYQFGIDGLAAMDANAAEFRLEGEFEENWDVRRRFASSLEPLLPSDAPIRLRFHRKTGRLGDFQMGDVSGTHLVSERFKALVERFEPGAHLFYPVKIRTKGGDLLSELRYLFKVGVLLDNAYDETRTAIGRLMPTRISLDDPKHIFVWRRAAIEGHHLWSDTRLNYGYYCSGEFRDAVLKEKLKWFKWRADEII